MSGPEIREKINSNNKRVGFLLNKFVLTDEINQILKENERLRYACPHEFEDGFCKYCDMPIEFAEE